jgi:predicted CopG family antitoxin
MSSTQVRICTRKRRGRRTVLLRPEVYEKLRGKGRFGDSFSDIVSRLLEAKEEKEKGEGVKGDEKK